MSIKCGSAVRLLKFNGVSYLVQKGAEAVFTPEGRKQIEENIAYYRKNASIITQALDALGIWYTGGKNSPYIWLRCPDDWIPGLSLIRSLLRLQLSDSWQQVLEKMATNIFV